jgi:hypothetical protein
VFCALYCGSNRDYSEICYLLLSVASVDSRCNCQTIYCDIYRGSSHVLKAEHILLRILIKLLQVKEVVDVIYVTLDK